MDLSDVFNVEKRAEPIRLACRQIISDYELVASRSQSALQYAGREIQCRLGSGVIDALWRVGGHAMVDLRIDSQRDYSSPHTVLDARADVSSMGSRTYTVPKLMMHHEFFPADWYCEHCGMLNDGLKRRTCSGCQAPKPKRYW